MSPGPEDPSAAGADQLVEDQVAEELGELRRRRVGCVARAAAVAAAVGLLALSVGTLVEGGDDPPSPDREADHGPLTAADLAGRTFVVVALEQAGVGVPLGAQPPSLMFGDATLQLDTGCNGGHGTVSVVDERLVVSGVSIDLKGCGGTLGRQEHALLDLLRTSTEAELVDGVLELRLRDRAAWAVDVTDQVAIDGPPRVDAVAPVAEHLLRTATDPLPQATFAVTPAAGFGPWSVVTAVGEPGPDGARRASAFVVASGADPGLPRVPSEAVPPLEPSPGETVRPGQRVALAAAPVEGGATAYVNGVEVPTQVYDDAGTTAILVPMWARGEIVVTLSLSTPEEPTAYAAWYRVG